MPPFLGKAIPLDGRYGLMVVLVSDFFTIGELQVSNTFTLYLEIYNGASCNLLGIQRHINGMVIA
jgi:hypothetical protein